MKELGIAWFDRNTTVIITTSEADAGSEENIKKAAKIASINQELLPNTILGLEPPHYYPAMRRVFYVTEGKGVLIAGKEVIRLWPGLLVFVTSDQAQTIIPEHVMEMIEAFVADEESPDLARREPVDIHSSASEKDQSIGYFRNIIHREMTHAYGKRTLKHSGNDDIPEINIPLPELCQRLAIET